jgi:hypothetical protein
VNLHDRDSGATLLQGEFLIRADAPSDCAQDKAASDCLTGAPAKAPERKRAAQNDDTP